MKSKKKKSKAKKPATAKHKAEKAKAAPSAPTVEERLDVLEQFVATLATAPARGSPVPTTTFAAAAPAAAGALVDIGLDKSDTSPSLVRVTVKGRPGNALTPGADKGVIKSATVGSFLRIFVEVNGNPGDTASIEVDRATTGHPTNPNLLEVKIPMDAGQTIEPRSLLVTG